MNRFTQNFQACMLAMLLAVTFPPYAGVGLVVVCLILAAIQEYIEERRQ